MLKIDVYHSGATVRVALHHHPSSADARCQDDCYEYARTRAYAQPHETPRQYRERTVQAVLTALMTPEIGHAEFTSLVGEQLSLF